MPRDSKARNPRSPRRSPSFKFMSKRCSGRRMLEQWHGKRYQPACSAMFSHLRLMLESGPEREVH